MQSSFYTTEMMAKARIAETLQKAEHDRMVRIADEGSGWSEGYRPRWPNLETIRLSRVTLPRLPRLARLFAR